jgi:hypothetical protein
LRKSQQLYAVLFLGCQRAELHPTFGVVQHISPNFLVGPLVYHDWEKESPIARHSAVAYRCLTVQMAL